MTTTRIVRTQVRELLSRSPSFRALPRAQRSETSRNAAAVIRFLADGNDLNSHLALRLTEIRDGAEVAASLTSQVDFPGFVAGLIHGVFNVIVASSVEQMHAYTELLGAVAEQIDQFVSDSAKQSNDYLVHRWPQWFTRLSGGSIRFQAETRSVALSEILATLAPGISLTRPSLASVRRAARLALTFERQQAALRDIDQRMQHIAPVSRDPGVRFELTKVAPEYPGVYVEEIPTGVTPIEGVTSGTAGFVGLTKRNDAGGATKLVTSWSEFERIFGGTFQPLSGQEAHQFLPYAVEGFFANGGTRAYIAAISLTSGEEISDAHYLGNSDPPTGLAALAQLEDINILLVPGVTTPTVQQAMVTQCETRRDRVALLDLPIEPAQPWTAPAVNSSYAAAFWPWLITADKSGRAIAVPPSGCVAGQYARLPANRAPRGEAIADSMGLSYLMNDAEQAKLTDAHINPLRIFTGRPGPVLWGLRSLSDDPEWRYLLLRRYTIYLKQSIVKGLQWTVFEPKTSTLWQTVTSHAENFLYNEWRNGALLGAKPQQAFFVKCDRTTMTQADIDNGRLIVSIGIAPIRPAEFVIIRIGLCAAR